MALTDCLTDWVGVEGCDSGTAGSGKYINQLEGMELKMLDYIATEQQGSFSGVWTDVQKRAITMFGHDVRQMLNKRYRLKSVTQSVDMGKIIDTTSTTASGANYRGITLELNSDNDTLTGSNLHLIHVRQLFIYSNYAGVVPVKIYDLDLGTVLESLTPTLASGWNTIAVNESYDAKRIYVCFDTTNITSVELDLNDLKNAVNGDGCCDFNFDFGDVCCGITLKGANSTIAAPTTITEGNNSFGLSATFSVVCSWDSFICNNINLFTDAFMYCLGMEVMNQRIFTSRLNEFTVFDRDKAYELRKLYQVKYKGGVMDEMPYEGLLTQSVEGVNMNQYDCCIEPNATINFAEARL